uniref:Calponin-homology (CH) domain-containing protein n=1 Tax=Meloidogyne hapla TaxID=6305 RepID=A0A1I8AY61_MELHA
MSNDQKQQIIENNNNPNNIRRYISQLYVIPAVDASEAGKGQLEISVNQGQVPNNVQMQDAGRCLVTFIPQHAGTYVIDVTFNGLQVHGCPIKVDVRERQVGKPVSAPVYARPTTSTISPPPTRGPSSSAYFSSTSPQAAPSPSYTAAAPSPSSTPQLPRSPPLVAGVEAALLGGYTVAQYGNGGDGGIPSTKLKPSPLSTPPSTRPKPKLFEEKEIPISRPTMPEAAQLEMTRSAEMTLFRDIPKTPVTTPVEAGREIPIQHSFERIPEQKHYQPKEIIKITQKLNDLPYAPLEQNIKKTLELLQQQQRIESIREREIIAPVSSAISPISTESGAPQIQTHIVDPYSSDIEAMTPGTRRRLLEHSVYKATELKETPTDHEESETALSSKQSSKTTTPKLSLKFRGSKDKVGSITPPTMTTATISAATASDAFDWGKSKITSKHEVIRRGKEVDVRIDSLKLGKEDQLYVIVLPPGIVARQNMPNELPTSEQALPHKLKKSGTKSWEISFRPSVVGTHKVHIFVNTIPHPQSPFPIRVYDASQIVVGDIVRQSVLNDTVEFTVDAGRAGFGNLEMAIKDNEGIIIPSHVSQLEAGAAKFLVTFTPNLPGTHTVHITFNKEVVTGSPFEVHIIEPPILGQESQISKKKKKDKKSKEKHSLNGTQRGEPPIATMSPTASGRPMVSKLPSLSRVGQPVDLLVTLSRPDDLVQAQVHDLDREPLLVETFPDYTNNTCKLQFIPKRVGDHEVEIRVAGTEIDGSPFTCRVYDPTKILVGEIPDGAVDKPVSFVVDASQAGVGNLEVAVNEGKIPSMAYALGQHKYEITFIPKEPIDHRVSVRFNNEYVPGSPFLCRLITSSSPSSPQQQHQQLPQKQISLKSPRQIGASGPGLERIPVGQPTEFFVDGQPLIEGTTDLLPRVQITDPRGELLSVDIAAYEEEPSRSIVRYTPKSVGNHQIFVKLNNQPIPGSPFTAKAFDASCVKLALESEGGQVGRSCAFTIDAAKAGAGNMEIIVSVEKRNVPNYVQPEGQARFRVTFTPQEAIEHLISVKFNGVSVPGSPLRCPIQPSSVQRSPRPIRAGSEQQIDEQQQLFVVPQQPTSVETEEKEIKLVGDLASAIVDEPKRFSIDAPPGIGRKVECNVIVVGGFF